MRIKASIATTPGVLVERDLVADSQASSGFVEDDSVLRSVSGACESDDSSEEVLVDLAVDSTATGKHDLEDGIVAVRNDSSVQFSVGRALDSSVTGTCDLDGVPVVRASSPATVGDGNRSRLLEVIESVFLPCLVTRFANSPNSSLRMSSHARARALCFAASAFLSDPHSALHSLPALMHMLMTHSCMVP